MDHLREELQRKIPKFPFQFQKSESEEETYLFLLLPQNHRPGQDSKDFSDFFKEVKLHLKPYYQKVTKLGKFALNYDNSFIYLWFGSAIANIAFSSFFSTLTVFQVKDYFLKMMPQLLSDRHLSDKHLTNIHLTNNHLTNNHLTNI